MSNSLSRAVTSSQAGPHPRLPEIVLRHLNAEHLKPAARHTKDAFAHMLHWIGDRKNPLIMDACCGVGDSSRNLADAFPDHLVIGVDKSAHRLERGAGHNGHENLFLLRADLNDLYPLLVTSGLIFDRHYILYPNPWPKPGHLGRRWHGAPVFRDLIKLGGRFEVRSNWRIYLAEFQIVLDIAGTEASINRIFPDPPLTPFEAKYHASGQDLWQLVCESHPASRK